MKKITLLCLTLILLCLSFNTVKADGLDSKPISSPAPEIKEYENHSTEIEKKEVKSPNNKTKKTIPVIITIVVLGATAGGVYFYKKRN